MICNFVPVAQEARRIGVPFKGKYKEVFNSDAKKFGGSGWVNPRVKQSKAQEADEREQSISVKIAPLGIQVFRYEPLPEKVTGNKGAKKKPAARKSKGKTAGVDRIKKAMMEENR